MLDGLVHQDVVMIEQEQKAYLKNPARRSYELNPTVKTVQRLIRQQADTNSPAEATLKVIKPTQSEF